MPVETEIQTDTAANPQAEKNKSVQAECRNLKPAFVGGADNRIHDLVRRINSELYKEFAGKIDITEEKTTDSAFVEALTNMVGADGADAAEIGQSVGKYITNALQSAVRGADRSVTLKGGVTAMDMVKEYLNYRPAAKLRNQTYANAV